MSAQDVARPPLPASAVGKECDRSAVVSSSIPLHVRFCHGIFRIMILFGLSLNDTQCTLHEREYMSPCHLQYQDEPFACLKQAEVICLMFFLLAEQLMISMNVGS